MGNPDLSRQESFDVLGLIVSGESQASCPGRRDNQLISPWSRDPVSCFRGIFCLQYPFLPDLIRSYHGFSSHLTTIYRIYR